MPEFNLTKLQRFKVEVRDHVAVVAMANPPVNAQDAIMREELVELFDYLGGSNTVRCIVLTAQGRHFSAGADLGERGALSDTPGGYAAHNRRVRAGFDVISQCPKPVIAAVDGAAIGAGCVMALCCDIILVTTGAFFAMTEVNVGLAGGVRHVVRHFGQSNARYLILTAERVYGPDLYRMNVATRLCEPETLLTQAMEIAALIASKSPLAERAAKRSFDVTEGMPLHDGYRFEQSQTAALADSDETREAQAAFREKRAPVFRDK